MSDALSVIIAAGGSSQRYGERDKLLEMLGGLPVLLHSIRSFAPCVTPGCLVVAARSGALQSYQAAAEKFLPEIPVLWVCGGTSRTASVRNALAALPAEKGLVAVHDAARPLADEKLLLRVAERAAFCGGAIAAAKVVDSLKLSADGRTVSSIVSRDNLWRAETPQIFDLSKLRLAYSQLGTAEPTDDAEVMRLAGFPVELVESGCCNLKLTNPGDLTQLEFFYRKKSDAEHAAKEW